MDLNQVKQVLLDQEAELISRVDRTHNHIHHREQPVSADFSEQVTEMEHEEIIHALDGEGRVELKRIRIALQRLESGDYPYCAMCGEDIGEQRLLAVPQTSQCIDCAKQADSVN